jgi:predicted ATPase
MPEEAAYQRSWADDKSWRADPPQIQGDPGPDSLWLHRSPEASSLFALLSSMHRFTLQPRAMCRAVEADAALEEDGDGFPALLDRLQNIAPEIFEDLQERVRRAFPGVRYIRTPPVPGGLRELAVAEAGAPGLVYGAQLSDGLLLLIGYLALALAPGIRTLVLMLDEPEMGLHMERSNFLVDLMRRLSKGEFGRPVQVILTTHSPDVVDFLSPDEVVVFERSAGGSIHAQRLSDVPDLRARLKGFNLGEYWSSYGEAGLLRGEEG